MSTYKFQVPGMIFNFCLLKKTFFEQIVPLTLRKLPRHCICFTFELIKLFLNKF